MVEKLIARDRTAGIGSVLTVETLCGGSAEAASRAWEVRADACRFGPKLAAGSARRGILIAKHTCSAIECDESAAFPRNRISLPQIDHAVAGIPAYDADWMQHLRFSRTTAEQIRFGPRTEPSSVSTRCR